jgi:hypothetical protein
MGNRLAARAFFLQSMDEMVDIESQGDTQKKNAYAHDFEG